MKVWLDDVRPTPNGWVLARNVEDAKTLLAGGGVSNLSLGYDLGGEGPDASALCLWMALSMVFSPQSGSAFTV